MGRNLDFQLTFERVNLGAVTHLEHLEMVHSWRSIYTGPIDSDAHMVLFLAGTQAATERYSSCGILLSIVWSQFDLTQQAVPTGSSSTQDVYNISAK